MRILILGSGAREHAIAYKVSQSSKITEVIVSPGNAGINKEFACVSLKDFQSIGEYINENNIELVIVGPENLLAEGIVDFLRERNVAVIGPTKEAARIESSKAFAKSIMVSCGVPTAKYVEFSEYECAKMYINEQQYPLVIKADGLAAGKGVLIAKNKEEAEEYLTKVLIDDFFGTAGKKLIIEEYLEGWEASIFAFCDGEHFVSTIFSQDHKQVFDGDYGPNTGGMGAYAPVDRADSYKAEVDERVFKPVLAKMQELGIPFTGVLFAGLMITSKGIQVIEFNCRFGDPETEVILPLLENDLLEICEAMITKRMNQIELKWKPEYAVTVVAASQGYPGDFKKGIEIENKLGIDAPIKVYYAGGCRTKWKINNIRWKSINSYGPREIIE